jgi:hypothetical protein
MASNTVRGVAVVGVWAIVACSPGAGSDAFYPLDEGRTWTYRVTKNLDDAAEPDIHELAFAMKESVTLATGAARRRHSDEGGDYFLRSDGTGIYRSAARDALDVDAKLDSPPRYVLKQPFAVGTQWESMTVPYVLQRRNEVPKEVRYATKPILMVYGIAALNQDVSTPAGDFKGCIKVAGEAKIKLYVDAQFSWRDIPLFTNEWYCPGVGLAKLERIEASPSKFMRGGNVTLELMAYKK